MTLALLAMVARGLVAPGYMVSPVGSDHAVAVTLCSGHSSAPLLLDLATGKSFSGKPSGKAKAVDKPCTFAALALAAAPPASIALAAPLEISFPPRAPRHERPALTPTGPPLPARGPPQIA